jgi:hypothetical protein
MTRACWGFKRRRPAAAYQSGPFDDPSPPRQGLLRARPSQGLPPWLARRVKTAAVFIHAHERELRVQTTENGPGL